MKLWLIEQDVNNGYDTYDSAVVAAETEEAASMIHPQGGLEWRGNGWRYIDDGRETFLQTWASPDAVKVRKIGTADPDTPAGVILASFNAG